MRFMTDLTRSKKAPALLTQSIQQYVKGCPATKIEGEEKAPQPHDHARRR